LASSSEFNEYEQKLPETLASSSEFNEYEQKLPETLASSSELISKFRKCSL
jgi:hypothetical protein